VLTGAQEIRRPSFQERFTGGRGDQEVVIPKRGSQEDQEIRRKSFSFSLAYESGTFCVPGAAGTYRKTRQLPLG